MASLPVVAVDGGMRNRLRTSPAAAAARIKTGTLRDVTAIAGYVREVLLDPVSLSRPYLQKRAVETAVKRHLKGDRNYTTAIHRLLTMELLHRLFLDAG